MPAIAGAATIHWNKAVRIDASKYGGVDSVACASTQLCVAGDDSGSVITTTKPTGGAGSWAKASVDSGNALTGISCPTTTLCVAVDDVGNVVTSTNPTGGAKAWTRPARIDATTATGGGYAGFAGIDCPTTTLCVAVDNAAKGNVVVSTDPAGGARTWHATAIGGTLTAVSCASATMCVVVGTEHDYSTDPAGGASAWHATGAQTGGGVFSAIDCPNSGFCAAVGYGNTSTGLATTSNAPKSDSTPWRTVAVEPTPANPGEGVLDAIGCPVSGLCIAIDGFDNAYVSTAPSSGVWGGAAAIRPGSASQSTSMACTSAFCVVTDSAGVETTGVVKS